MSRDLVKAYLEQPVDIFDASKFSDASKLPYFVPTSASRALPEVYHQLYYILGKGMEISLGGPTKIKEEEDVAMMRDHYMVIITDD
jgi:hypothetical protein